MIIGIQRLVARWFESEPAAALMIFVTAFLLLGAAFTHLRRNESAQKSPVGALFLSSLVAAAFVVVVSLFYTLLKESYSSFVPLAWSLERGDTYQKEVDEAEKKWGSAIAQNDLMVAQEISHIEVKQIPGSENKVLYINKVVTETLKQESILGFDGSIKIHMIDDRLNMYSLEAVYQYEVANQSELTTTAKFQFPIGMNRTVRNLKITMDGKDIDNLKSIKDGIVSWEMQLLPQQHVHVVVSYLLHGMGSYTYAVSTRRPIQDFSLTITVDKKDIYQITQPDTTAIKHVGKSLDGGYTQTWTIKNSILSPTLGIKFEQKVLSDPDQEYVIQLVQFMPRGLMLLSVTILMTFLIFGVQVDLWRFSLFLATFSAVFLTLMGFDLIKVNHWTLLPLLALLALLLVRKIYQGLPSSSFFLTLSLSSVFLVGYPHAGLLQDEASRNAFDTIAQALIILYVFVIAFYVRVQKNSIESRMAS